MEFTDNELQIFVTHRNFIHHITKFLRTATSVLRAAYQRLKNVKILPKHVAHFAALSDGNL
jgi:hypothetical protein